MARRLIELWEAPRGHRLASVIATTYNLRADFLEEDLLPVALGLRLPPARGRDFRVELEYALTDTEVSVFFHPGRYQPGLRRSPRIDLIPLPEGRYPKLHAKVALLRFVAPESPEPGNQIVRLVVGSANLTNSGYRSNIEVAASLEDAPGTSSEAATAVRDAVDWLEGLIGSTTNQVTGQFRDMKAVFMNRLVSRQDTRLRFVGLPSANGFPRLTGSQDRVCKLTIASPFWPLGNDLSDVVAALGQRCGGRWGTVRLIGQAVWDDKREARPVIPASLVRDLLAAGAKVEVAAADPGYGCAKANEDEEGEFDKVGEGRQTSLPGNRSLHAKALLAVGDKTTRLAIGSFNLTRKGLGLVNNSNAEAGLLWALPNDESSSLSSIVSFATAWRKVTRGPENYVVEPGKHNGDDEDGWPTFILFLGAKREELTIKGDSTTWPEKVVIRMRDIRSRLYNQEHWFDAWTVSAPAGSEGIFVESTSLSASWLDQVSLGGGQLWPALPDLEARVSWNGNVAVLPVVFEDKHLFPVVESRHREDEQSLVAWFLGLRPPGEMEDGGFGHSVDPIPGNDELPPLTQDILSYLVRDFVHALPGIRNRLSDAGVTETGLRAALMGHRSPVELARQSLHAYRNPQPGRPSKTAVATAFQLAELRDLLNTVLLPVLADNVTNVLRAEALDEVSRLFDDVVAELPTETLTEVVRTYLGLRQGQT